MAGFGIHLEYEVGIIQWHDDFYVHPSDDIRQDVSYYHCILAQLVSNQVRFRPYHLYPIWAKLTGEITSIR